MLTFLGAILAGLVCGVLSGFGIGGGSLLMVWMTAVLSMEQKAAQGVNLLYFLPCAACALIPPNPLPRRSAGPSRIISTVRRLTASGSSSFFLRSVLISSPPV